MLADPEELRPYRREILKLYPGFINYPVWDDLSKPLRSGDEEQAAGAAPMSDLHHDVDEP
ncbi:hypothetical protein LTR36_009918 [Oleoguttula mirabilis]|uniref:Uncharacterized protein n=1 Tax=Oleoguttula mirabilis TaxID=1507867 RepID=A0AAV9J5D1_9PEZI|nr:hypothetical protein LTR36_009918 [Oleoguttula mirabilis]